MKSNTSPSLLQQLLTAFPQSLTLHRRPTPQPFFRYIPCDFSYDDDDDTITPRRMDNLNSVSKVDQSPYRKYRCVYERCNKDEEQCSN